MSSNRAPQLEQSSTKLAGKGHGKVMLITPDRVLYAGLLGSPQAREFGALTIYVSLGTPFHIQLRSDAWESAEMRVVQPDTPHRIANVDKMIGVFMIEPENIDMKQLPSFLQPEHQGRAYPLVLAQLREAFFSLIEGRVHVNAIRTQLDQFVLGAALAARTLERRIASVINSIKRQPCDILGADNFAQQVGLSFSRFLHLFKAEVGTTFRRFRAWKRARSFLAYVNTEMNLTDIALETGYPDSSHFSHTMRRYWGLTPKNIIAGSRRLAVTTDGSSYISAVL